MKGALRIAGGLVLAYLAVVFYLAKKMLDLRFDCDIFDDED